MCFWIHISSPGCISADGCLVNNLQHTVLDATDETFMSPVSLWEAIITYQIGKVELPESPETYLSLQCDCHLISSLPLDEESVTRLAVIRSYACSQAKLASMV